MGRPTKGPRLYLRRDGDKRVWIIRTVNGDVRTGLEEMEKLAAMRALAEYVNNRAIPAKPMVGNGLVYFVTCLTSDHYPVKIGWCATGLVSRVAAMQIGNPNVLSVLATLAGTQDDERSLHAYFQHLHIRGEWFRRAPALIDYIKTLPELNDAWGAEEFLQAG